MSENNPDWYHERADQEAIRQLNEQLTHKNDQTPPPAIPRREEKLSDLTKRLKRQLQAIHPEKTPPTPSSIPENTPPPAPTKNLIERVIQSEKKRLQRP